MSSIKQCGLFEPTTYASRQVACGIVNQTLKQGCIKMIHRLFSVTKPDEQTDLPEAEIEDGVRSDDRAIVLDVSRIRCGADHVRKTTDDSTIHELAASIKQHGLQQPIVVQHKPDEHIYELVAGERRFTAINDILGYTEIRASVIDVESQQEVRWLQLHENLHRRALRAADIADMLQAALDRGMSRAEIAKRLGKDRSFVDKCLGVQRNLSPEAKAVLKRSPQGASLSTVYSVSTVAEADQAQVAKEIVDQRMSKRQAAERVATTKKKSKAKGKRRGRQRPFSRTYRLDGGVSIVIKCQRSELASSEILNAARQLVQQCEHQEPGLRRAA